MKIPRPHFNAVPYESEVNIDDGVCIYISDRTCNGKGAYMMKKADESEKRRQRLLEETRALYSDRRNVPEYRGLYRNLPAVHPRYGASYRELYGQDGAGGQKGTFGIRLLLCCFLFTFFVTLDRQEIEIFEVDSGQIEEAVSQDIDIGEFIPEK